MLKWENCSKTEFCFIEIMKIFSWASLTVTIAYVCFYIFLWMEKKKEQTFVLPLYGNWGPEINLQAALVKRLLLSIKKKCDDTKKKRKKTLRELLLPLCKWNLFCLVWPLRCIIWLWGNSMVNSSKSRYCTHCTSGVIVSRGVPLVNVGTTFLIGFANN